MENSTKKLTKTQKATILILIAISILCIIIFEKGEEFGSILAK